MAEREAEREPGSAGDPDSEAAAQEDRGFAALVALEAGMLRARRELRAAAASAAGEFALAAWCHLLEVPDGTLIWAGALTLAERSNEAPPPAELDPARTETLLVQADREPGPSGRRDVQVEHLEPPVASLLERCAEPATVDALAGWAAEQGASRDELASFIDTLVADGVLVAG